MFGFPRRAASVFLALALGTIARGAAAEEPPPEAGSAWYGWQTLTADGAAVALMVAGIVADNHPAAPWVGFTGGVSYVVTPAVIHGAHGHVWRGLGDAGLRIVFPAVATVVGGIVGRVVAPPPKSDEILSGLDAVFIGALTGFFVGIATASALDAAVLARDDAPATRPVPSAAAVVLRPVVAPTRAGATAGVAAVF